MKLNTFRKRLFSLFMLSSALLSFFFLDRQLLPWISSLPETSRQLFNLLSHSIFPPFILIGSVGAFLFTRFSTSKRELTLPLFEIATTQALAVAVVRLTKVALGRARPDIFIKEAIYGFHGVQLDHHYHSFPSGHTLAAFALATSLSLFLPRYRLQFYLAASLLSICRVLLAHHYFSDILGTALIGILLATLTHKILEKITGPVISTRGIPNE